METKVGVLYKEIIDAIRLLPLEQQAKIYNAVFDYQFTGQINDDDAFVKSFILSHKTNFDNMKSRREINTENGKKGGAKKVNQNARKKKSIDNYEEKQPKQPKTTENEQKQPKTTENEQKQPKDNRKQPTNNLKQEARNKKQEVKSKNNIIPQTQQPSAITPIKVVNKSPQQRMFDYFADRYQAMTGLKYLSKRSEFINLTDLIHKNGEELVKQKIQWLEIGCLNGIFWFSKNINSFTIGNLVRNWNEIMPIKTEEQKKEEAEQKKEEERMKRVLAEAQKIREERSK
jgi:hypothetical protein